MTSSATAQAERRSVPFLALVSIGILLASLMLGLRPATSLAAPAAPECLNPLDVIFILDRSGSMGTDSGDSTRLGEAIDAAQAFVNTLQANGGVGGASGLHHVGLVSYGGDAASIDQPLGDTNASDTNDAIGDLSSGGNTPLAAGMTAGRNDLAAGNARTDVDGVPVTHAFVLLSDGRPWPDVVSATRRPSATLIGNYLGDVEQAYSVILGVSDNANPATPNTLDFTLMQSLASNPSNYQHVEDADDLTDIFQGIVNDLLCGDINIDKTADPTELPAEGGSVTYTYKVTNNGDQGSAPFTAVSLEDTLGDAPGGDAGCAPLVRGSDDPGNDDDLLQAGETWVFTCQASLSETTQNWGCVTAEYVNSGGATTTDCDDATVVVAEPTPVPPPDEPSIDIDKSNDAEGTVKPGTEVEYTYDVTNTGNTALAITDLTDLMFDSDTVACDLSEAEPDSDAGDDGILSPDETWTFHCTAVLQETTHNKACVTAVVTNFATPAPNDFVPLAVAQVSACDDNTVVVGEPEGSVAGGTGTPVPSIPNTATSPIGFSGPLATLIFGAILLASLGTLAYANVRSTRERR